MIISEPVPRVSHNHGYTPHNNVTMVLSYRRAKQHMMPVAPRNQRNPMKRTVARRAVE